jgi:hypothetical protein
MLVNPFTIEHKLNIEIPQVKYYIIPCYYGK